MSQPTVLVTGANKGIGLEIAKQMAEKGFTVFLTARNPERGKQAVQQLSNKGLNVHFIELDVTNLQSIKQAVKLFKEQSDYLDVLVNNAGILMDKCNIVEMPMEVLEKTVTANAYGPIMVIQNFLPLIKQGGRIINISSGLGALHDMGSYSPAYSISKTMLNAITRQFSSVLSERGISLNSMCPGWVQTDMGGENASRSVEKGAETAVWLATESHQSLTGKFFRDKKEIDW